MTTQVDIVDFYSRYQPREIASLPKYAQLREALLAAFILIVIVFLHLLSHNCLTLLKPTLKHYSISVTVCALKP